MRILFALLLALVAAAAHAEIVEGVVIVVIDGDTVLFKPDHYAPSTRAFLKVRLAGIDAPEAGQPYGEAATIELKSRVLKRRGRLDVVAADVYGRKIGRLEVENALVNAELVRCGCAWATAWQGDAPWRALADEAQRARRGLWQDAAPVPPWKWRRGVR